ncbi:MAG: ABC transporter permease [Burkholderiales bacterium]|jgi:ABC-type transport system involved in multi-copper enzyme maturation permease subunit|nr:ABC transporter permease [Burkholderiales bacterium]
MTPRRADASQRIAAIARFVWLEAWRTRLFVVVAALAAGLWLASVFVQTLAITEATRAQTAVLAATLRLALVAVVALHGASSFLRELQDKGTELLLSLDMTRAEFLAGKAAGQTAVAVAAALVTAVPVLATAPHVATLVWIIGLACEATLVALATLFAVVTLRQLLPAALFVVAFYLLARAMPAVLLIARASPLVGPSPSHDAMERVLSGIALLLPPLDRFASADTLANATAAWAALPGVVVATVATGAVLFAAAAFDLYRRNF